MTIKGNFPLKNRTVLTAGFLPVQVLVRCTVLALRSFETSASDYHVTLRHVTSCCAVGGVVAQYCCCRRRFIRRWFTQASMPPEAKLRVHGVRTVHCDVTVGLIVTIECKNRTDALCGQ